MNNTTAHIPTICAVYRHFRPGGRERWRRVVEAAALTDEELARAHGKRTRSPAGDGR